MNREILFRAKQIENGEWIEGDLIHSTRVLKGIKTNHTLIGIDMDTSEVNPDTVCQFTGLKDINGAKIWEGDILKFIDRDSKYTYCVVFENGSFVCYHSILKNWDGTPYKWGLLLRVNELGDKFKPIRIGNIFDNPELLEKSDDAN